MHELFFNLIHDKVEEEVKKDNKDLRRITLGDKEMKKKSEEIKMIKKGSIIDININDLDIQQLQNQSLSLSQFFINYL